MTANKLKTSSTINTRLLIGIFLIIAITVLYSFISEMLIHSAAKSPNILAVWALCVGPITYIALCITSAIVLYKNEDKNKKAITYSILTSCIAICGIAVFLIWYYIWRNLYLYSGLFLPIIPIAISNIILVIITIAKCHSAKYHKITFWLALITSCLCLILSYISSLKT